MPVMADSPYITQIDDLIARTVLIEGKGTAVSRHHEKGWMDGFGSSQPAYVDTSVEYDHSEMRQLTTDYYILVTTIMQEVRHPLVVQAEGLQRALTLKN
jgi:hypothetical protein